MQKIAVGITILLLVAAIGACTSGTRHHKTALPDPKSFNAHFGDMDADADAQVTPEEFNAFFDGPDPKVFEALDLNGDGVVDHDEWHVFKEAHGLKHHD